MDTINVQEYISALQAHPNFRATSLHIIWRAPINKKKQTFRTLNSDEYVRAVPELKVQEIDICSEYCNVQQRVELRNMVCHKYVLIKSLLKDVDTLCSKMDFKHKHIEYAVDKNRKIVLKNIQSSKKTKWITCDKDLDIRNIVTNSLLFHLDQFDAILKMDNIPLDTYNFYTHIIDTKYGLKNIDLSVNKYTTDKRDERITLSLAHFINDTFVCKKNIWYRPNVLTFTNERLMFDAHDTYTLNRIDETDVAICCQLDMSPN